MLGNPTRLLLLPLLPLLLAPSVTAQMELAIEDGDLEPLGASFAAYFEARASARELDEAREGFVASLATLKKQLAGGDPLSFPALPARALWLSHGYARQKKIRAGKVTADELEGGSFDGSPLGYAYRVPRDYDPKRPYPLILAIPDHEESPAEHIRTHWMLAEIRDGAIVVSPEMPEQEEAWDRVVINGRPGGLCNLLTTLRLAGERFAVDFDRIYVAGRGVGVSTAVAAGNYSPQRFAGIVGRTGTIGDLIPENFSNLPTFFIGAGAKASTFQAAAKAAGFDNCKLERVGGEVEIWSWMQANPRETYPTAVTVVPGNPFPTRAYWLRIAPCTATPRATGRVDRESNTIIVDGEGVSHATLFLNDQLVDLGRPVRVVCNGVENVIELERHVPTTLNLICDGTSDEACVYVADAMFDMSGDPAAARRDEPFVEDVDYRRLLGEAGERPRELWELYQWCLANQREVKAPNVLRRLLRFDPEHEPAREALGHVREGAQWFTSADAAKRFRRRQDPERAAALGFVQQKSLWMHPDDRAIASKGQVKDQETGLWLSAADRRRVDKGWVRQDVEWISPEEAGFVDEGLWLVDGEWLDLPSANTRHSRIEAMWVIPTAEVTLYSTVDRDVSFRAMREMRRAILDLNRVFGAEPALPLRVCVTRDEEQYDRLAFGNPDGRRRATHADRLHVIHSAFFAESWYPRVEGKREFRGMGVCYWDALMPNGDLYGVHSARLAAGLSYVDALDPSPKTVRLGLKDGPDGDYNEAYGAEKKLPAWLRYGGAVYGERYFRDETITGDGDPWWARKWSLENLASRGGLRPLREVLDFPLDADNRDDALKLLIEAGLVVSFLVDSEYPPVREEHERLKKAMRSGRLAKSQLEALAEVLLAHESELRKYAGM